MKATYTPPSFEEVGGVATLTAAFGSDPRADFSEFPQIPAATGSFDVCDPNRTNSDPNSNCSNDV